MIYTILRVAWWSLCLGICLWSVSDEWNNSFEEPLEKIFSSIVWISVCVLVAAAMQAFFTCDGIVFKWW